MKKFRKNFDFLVVLVFLLPSYCGALVSDNDKPISLTSDSAEINHKAGMSYYHGHVAFDQGTTHIRADEGTVQFTQNNQIIKAIAKSKSTQLAEYQTIPKEGDAILFAKARTIIWFAQQKKISLIGDATVVQGKNSYSAPHIDYDMVQKHVVSTASKQGKTTIMVYPEKKIA